MTHPMMTEWQENIQTALNTSDNKVTARFFQLATVDQDQTPAVRTVVFRGFLENTNNIIIHTDLRSEKIAQLEKNDKAQLCWYFVTTREQFRISGKVECVAHNTGNEEHERLLTQQWNALSASAKSSYEWDMPGVALCPSQTQLDSTQPNNPVSVSEHFALLLFVPSHIDHLQLATTPHHRRLYHWQDQHWQHRDVNP